MSIAEFEVDGFAANFGDGYLLPGGSVMEPVNLLSTPKLLLIIESVDSPLAMTRYFGLWKSYQ